MAAGLSSVARGSSLSKIPDIASLDTTLGKDREAFGERSFSPGSKSSFPFLCSQAVKALTAADFLARVVFVRPFSLALQSQSRSSSKSRSETSV